MCSAWSETQDVYLKVNIAKHICYCKFIIKLWINAKLSSFCFLLILQLLQVSLALVYFQLEDSKNMAAHLFVCFFFFYRAWNKLPSPVSKLVFYPIITAQSTTNLAEREIAFTNQLQNLSSKIIFSFCKYYDKSRIHSKWWYNEHLFLMWEDTLYRTHLSMSLSLLPESKLLSQFQH